MPHYTATSTIACPLPDLFAFFSKPKNLLLLAPPDLNLELVSGPEIMHVGARLAWKGRRWGISQQIIQEVAIFEVEKRIEVEQKQGPFARWRHAHHFTADNISTVVVEKIDFEPPGGMLGFLVTANTIRKDLDKLTAYREKRLKEIFG